MRAGETGKEKKARESGSFEGNRGLLVGLTDLFNKNMRDCKEILLDQIYLFQNSHLDL